MKLRIITDKEYVTIPTDELNLIQEFINSTQRLIFSMSLVKIENDQVNYCYQDLIAKGQELFRASKTREK